MSNAYTIQQEFLKNVTNPTIFDIGAFIGTVSIDYRKIFPNSVIYAFEPCKESYDRLIENTKEYDIKCFNTAVGNVDGKISFNINGLDQTDSIFDTHPDGNKNWSNPGVPFNGITTIEKREVDVCTLDTFMKQYNIERVDVIKMDTQGTEYTIIEGAVNAIKENKIKIVYTEIITMPTYVGQKHLDEVIKLFRDNNFWLYDIYGHSYTGEKRLRQIDAMFIHESI